MATSPSEEEAAAIVAAVEALWPKPAAAAPGADAPSRWKFSGRWWLSGTTPAAAQRQRP
ncbi:MAG TPA: hypothetical protein VHF47_09535 [Acidimicrobiales bacterium]|nr:hypothetical protein [Acidimicrobiales bacterium]